MISSAVIMVKNGKLPVGYVMHLADIYCDEIIRVTEKNKALFIDDFNHKANMLFYKLIYPMISIATKCNHYLMPIHVKKNVFDKIVEMIVEEDKLVWLDQEMYVAFL
jgi:hypothetical protein